MTESDDDQLRRMLSDLDPMSGVPVEPVTSPQARHRLEQIMQSTHTEPESNVVPLRRRPRAILAAAASVAVLALGIGIGVSQVGGSSDPAPTTMALKAPGGDPMMMSCLAFDPAALRTMQVAFGGTVTALDKSTVTIDVDRWFKGGDADRVTVALPPGDISPALIPGVDFVKGERFLVTAAEGTVNGCGFSGPATVDYEKSFNEAFGG